MFLAIRRAADEVDFVVASDSTAAANGFDGNDLA
jgi:hypothetical protein